MRFIIKFTSNKVSIVNFSISLLIMARISKFHYPSYNVKCNHTSELDRLFVNKSQLQILQVNL